MNYYLATISDGIKPQELIAIALINEVGNEYYAMSSDHNYTHSVDINKTLTTIRDAAYKPISQIKRDIEEFLQQTDENKNVIWSRQAHIDQHIIEYLSSLGEEEYVANINQSRDSIGFNKEHGPKIEKYNVHNALSMSQYCKALHDSLIIFESKNKYEEINREWQDLHTEITKALETYANRYNKVNTPKIELSLKLNERTLPANSNDPNAYIKQAALTLLLREGGLQRVLISKTFGFRIENEYKKEYDWKLLLYRELLFELTGSAIAFGQLQLSQNQ